MKLPSANLVDRLLMEIGGATAPGSATDRLKQGFDVLEVSDLGRLELLLMTARLVDLNPPIEALIEGNIDSPVAMLKALTVAALERKELRNETEF